MKAGNLPQGVTEDVVMACTLMKAPTVHTYSLFYKQRALREYSPRQAYDCAYNSGGKHTYLPRCLAPLVAQSPYHVYYVYVCTHAQ